MTLSKLTGPTRPPSTSTAQTTRPAGVSMRTVVTGSSALTMPVATRVMAVPIRQWPHIGTYSSCSMMITAKSAPSSIGGSSSTEHIMPLPRGSKLSRRRRPSSWRQSQARLSSSERPGGIG